MANAVGSQTFSDQGNRASSGTGELVPNDFSPRIVGALVILVMLVSVIVLQLWVFPAVESEDSGPKLMTASTWIHYLTILFTFLVGCLPILGSPNNGTKVTPIGLGVLFAFILSVHGQIIKEKISERTAKLASKTVIEETVQTLNDLRAKAGAIPRLQGT